MTQICIGRDGVVVYVRDYSNPLQGEGAIPARGCASFVGRAVRIHVTGREAPFSGTLASDGRDAVTVALFCGTNARRAETAVIPKRHIACVEFAV